MTKLRWYQEEAAASATALVQAGRSPLVALGTGAGKTVVFVDVLKRLAVPALVVTHVREIVEQAYGKVIREGLDAGVIMAGHRTTPDAPVQVASIQTLSRRLDSVRYMLSRVKVIVGDEAHHCCSPGYQALREACPGVPWVGPTATPYRLDGQGLGSAGFTDIVAPVSVQRLCDEGYLIEPQVISFRDPDMSQARKIGGDFRTADAALAMRSVLVGDVIQHWRKYADGARTVAFTVDVAHSLETRDRFRAAGIPAEHVAGDTPQEERERILAGLRSGRVRVVSNCSVYGEGVDIPEIACVIQLRPTQSGGLHRQQIGRSMRPADGKRAAIVLDHAGNVNRHFLVTDPVEFSLDGQARVKPSPTVKCVACGAMVPRTENACTHCGMLRREPVAAFGRRRPEHIEGELVPINIGQRDAEQREKDRPAPPETFEERAAFWAKCWRIGQAKGKPIVARMMFKTRCGAFPVAVEGRLLRPEDVNADKLPDLLKGWRAEGLANGWAATKVAWFVRQCEVEARRMAQQKTAVGA